MADNDKIRHDFRNHLGIIRGFAEILLGEVEADDPRRGPIEEIHHASGAALDLLNQVFPADTTE